MKTIIPIMVLTLLGAGCHDDAEPSHESGSTCPDDDESSSGDEESSSSDSGDSSDSSSDESESSDGESSDSSSESSSSESTGADVVNGWPDVYLFRPVEVWDIHEGETVTLVARVRDPDDNMDYVRLLTFGGAELGTFERVSNEQFEFEVSWETLAAFGLDEPNPTFEWKFTAEAYDTEGAMAVGFTPLWLQCADDEVICNGDCQPAIDVCED